MKAFVFPGQGSQFSGMGKELYQNSSKAKQLFEQANDILSFDIASTMFDGSDEELKQTKVTQPAIFIHSVILAKITEGFEPDMVAGHSLGEFSALVSSGVLSFEEGLKLVSKRALAMQEACEKNPSAMAAILGLDDAKVEQICAEITAGGNVVVAANYNCPGQLVISGTNKGIELACVAMKEAGAKRALPLPVGGAFHSPLMNSAKIQLESAINATKFNAPICPIYQNVDALPATDIDTIKKNLIAQLTAPVRWTQSVQKMTNDGASIFVECGPGKVLQGLVKKIRPSVEVTNF